MAVCRAAVITEFHKPLEIRAVEVPALEPTAMLAKVEAATLCGTDIHRWHGDAIAPERVPYIPGHETCGIIEAMAGERYDLLGHRLEPGDRVLWAYPSCGHCRMCTVAKQPTLCKKTVFWGANRVDRYPYLLGGCAEYQYVPPNCAVIRVPDAVSPPLAAAAACALRTVMHGFERLGQVAGYETVVIQGSGPLGLFATAVAKDRGAFRVLLIGAPAERLEVGKALGADAVLDLQEVATPAARQAWVLDHTDGEGADVVVQVATNAAIPEGVPMLRPGGRYLSIGGGGGNPSLPVGTMPRMLTYIGVLMAEPRHWLEAVRFLEKRGDLPFERMITRTYSLDQVTDAFAAMSRFEVVKAVIYPNG